jgi:hypothetical protein
VSGGDALTGRIKKIRTACMGVGIIGLAPCVAGAFFEPKQFYHSYLLGYVFWIGIALGSLSFLMVHHLTSGRWGVLTRRIFESALCTLPLMAAYAIPLLFGLSRLYKWTDAAAAAADPKLQAKQFYLNYPSFYGRQAVYFIIWLILAYFLYQWSSAQDKDKTEGPNPLHKMRYLSGPGLILTGGAISFFVIDWVMALEPKFYSTVFGFQFMTSQALDGLAFAVFIAMLLSKIEPISELVNEKVLRDLGNLLLASLMLWAYIAFIEFLVIWLGDIPDKISWYLRRFSGGWNWLIWALVALHFFIPFLLLLQRSIKQRPRLLMSAAAWLLFFRLVYLFWMIEPAEHPFIYLHWMDVLAPLGMGGFWLAVFLWSYARRSLTPVNDPLYQEICYERREQ